MFTGFQRDPQQPRVVSAEPQYLLLAVTLGHKSSGLQQLQGPGVLPHERVEGRVTPPNPPESGVGRVLERVLQAGEQSAAGLQEQTLWYPPWA